VPASKHWVWVNDFVFPHMADGMAYLIDGDSGRYLERSARATVSRTCCLPATEN